jgi:hypothetical protein
MPKKRDIHLRKWMSLFLGISINQYRLASLQTAVYLRMPNKNSKSVLATYRQ